MFILKKADVHKICSNQVIFDLKTAVKELLENALDASAQPNTPKQIQIIIKNYG